MQDLAYTTQHQLRRGFSTQQIPICQQVHDLSVVQHAYVRSIPIVHPTYVRGLGHNNLCMPP
jgi:hypothetical protein